MKTIAALLTTLLLVGLASAQASPPSVTLSWTESTTVTAPTTLYFTVYRFAPTAGACVLPSSPTVLFASVTATTAQDTSVVRGTSYCYVLTASTVTNGEVMTSGFSNIAGPATPPILTAPNPPTTIILVVQ